MRACLIILLLLFPLPLATLAAEPACPPGNLLLGKAPHQNKQVVRTQAITDGQQPHTGAYWDTEYTAVFLSDASFLVYDLGQLTLVNALHIQADNNDTFELLASQDGEHFEPVLRVPAADDPGMQSRAIRAIGKPMRFIGIGEPRGDGYYSIGELQVYCQLPASWPVTLPLVGDAPAPTEGGILHWWSDREVRLSVHKSFIGALLLFVFLGLLSKRVREDPDGWILTPLAAAAALGYAVYLSWGILALGAVAILAAERLWWVYKQQRAEQQRTKKSTKKGAKGTNGKAWRATSERGALLAVMLVGVLTWTNFLTFHGVREVHLWDFMHYYVGSKYFAENEFTWLYHCALLAELDDGRGDEVMGRKYRSLKNNHLGPARLIVKEAEENCRANFSDERWQAFQQDLRIFRDVMSPSWFKDAFQDHGYNATPVWTAMGSAISNWGWRDQVPPPNMVFSPANLAGKTKPQADAIQRRFQLDRDRLYGRIKWLARIDLVLYIGIFGMLCWAFGLRVGALAIALWCVGHPWAYYWTGGSFGRIPWLFMSVAGLCAMKKGHNALAGAGITWAIMLRAFPGALAVGLALKFAWNALRERRIDRAHVQIIAGAAAAAVVLGSVSVMSAGFDSYPGFFANSAKHQSTPLTNHMGLRTFVTYHPRYAGSQMKDHSEDPYGIWKEQRRATFHDRRLLYAALALGALALVGATARRKSISDWELTSISTLLVFVTFELTSYYYCFLVILAPFCIRRPSYAIGFIATAIATQLASLSIGWFDDLFSFDSLMILVLLVYVIGSELWRTPQPETP